MAHEIGTRIDVKSIKHLNKSTFYSLPRPFGSHNLSTELQHLCNLVSIYLLSKTVFAPKCAPSGQITCVPCLIHILLRENPPLILSRKIGIIWALADFTFPSHHRLADALSSKDSATRKKETTRAKNAARSTRTIRRLLPLPTRPAPLLLLYLSYLVIVSQGSSSTVLFSPILSPEYTGYS
jgi:hypothetical protein